MPRNKKEIIEMGAKCSNNMRRNLLNQLLGGASVYRWPILSLTIFLFSCANGPTIERHAADEIREINNQAIEDFLHAYDRAIIVGDRPALEYFFDKNAQIEIVGPPPNFNELSYTTEEMINGVLGLSESPDYARTRTIEHIDRNSDNSEIVARSKVEDFSKIDDGRDIYFYFIELITLRANGPRISIFNYHAEYPEAPVSF
jgi:hypothetical protein